MADERENDGDDKPTPHNGVKVPRVARVNGTREPATPTAPSPKPKPSPLTNTTEAASERRRSQAEVHKSLAANDEERMEAVRALRGELRSVIVTLVELYAEAAGVDVDMVAMGAALSKRVFAGLRVRKGKHGNVIVPRRLSRVNAIAYGMGGGATDAYEKLAAIQATWPWVYAIVQTTVNVAAIGKATVKASSAKATQDTPQEPAQQPPESPANDTTPPATETPNGVD